MGTLTLYSASANLALLNTVFNGVAMFCTQNSLIWGFAALASLWIITSSVTSATIGAAEGKGGVVLANGSVNAAAPFIYAMCLTLPGLQSTVQVESTLNGAVTTIANVPYVIAVIPAAGSLISQEIGKVVTTAFQSASSNYPAISAQNNGFMNPLKTLLSARTAMTRLNGVQSEVQQVVAACLGPSSGVNPAAIRAAVFNAGNSGATPAQTLPIMGVQGSGLGALLYLASQQAGTVPGLVPNTGSGSSFAVGGTSSSSPSNNTFMGCNDAATQVAADIDAAVGSTEWARVVQGAVNGNDQPILGADYSFANMVTQYAALSNSATTGSVLAGGTDQATAEMLNLATSEMLNSSLDCIGAARVDLTTCQAAMIQATEVERHNIQLAANEVPMLKYAGAMANYFLALVIGLGPVIVMFMMFSGVNAGKTIKTAVHIILWPMLVLNVGAELVNGMLCVSLANFFQSVRQGGYIAPAEAITIYKELSLQIGTGSHIMSSLPVLMSTIFAFSEARAMASVVASGSPKSEAVSSNATPALQASAPAFANKPMSSIQQIAGGGSVLTNAGALPSVAGSMQVGSALSRVSSQIESRRTLSESEAEVKRSTEDFMTSLDADVASNAQRSQSILYSAKQGTGNSSSDGSVQTAGMLTSDGKGFDERTSYRAGLGLDLGAGFGGGAGGGNDSAGSQGRGFGGSGKLGASGNFGKDYFGGGAHHTDSRQSAGTEHSYRSGKEAHDAFEKMKSSVNVQQLSASQAERWKKAVSANESYENLLRLESSKSDAGSLSDELSNAATAYKTEIGTDAVVYAASGFHNAQFYSQQMMEGDRFDKTEGVRKYLDSAEKSTNTQSIVGYPFAAKAVRRMEAATLMMQDKDLSPEEKLPALKFLQSSLAALTGGGFGINYALGPSHVSRPNGQAPENHTGVNVDKVKSSVNKATSAGPAAPHLYSEGAFENKVDGEILARPSFKAGKELYDSVMNDANDAGVLGAMTPTQIVDFNIGREVKSIIDLKSHSDYSRIPSDYIEHPNVQ